MHASSLDPWGFGSIRRIDNEGAGDIGVEMGDPRRRGPMAKFLKEAASRPLEGVSANQW